MPRAEPPVAVQVKRQTLKQPPDIAQAIAASLEHLELVVQPFDKGAGLMVDKVVRDQLLPGVQQLEKAVKAAELALDYPLSPEAQAAQPIRASARRVEDGGQLFAQRDRLLQRRTVGQKPLQLRALVVVQVRRAFARRPQDVLEIVLQFVGERGAQSAHLLLA